MRLEALKRVTAAACLCAGGSVLQAVEIPQAFIELPVGTQATGVSADGSVVVGIAPDGRPFRWTEADGYVLLGGGTGALPSISADGQTIVANADEGGLKSAAIWLGGTAWQTLGSLGSAGCDGNLSFAYGVSGDGSTVVGLGYVNSCSAHAFSWEQSSGMVDLGSLVPNRPSRAADISDNGRVIVGWNDDAVGQRLAVKWVDGVESFITNGSNFNGEALAVNRDGSIITGRFCNFGTSADAWIWDKVTDSVTCVGLPSGGQLGENNAIYDTSDDGRVMGGWFHDNPNFREAVVYFDREPEYLENFLATYGFSTLQTWVTSGSVLSVSANRRVLAGWGRNPIGQLQGFIVKLGLDPPQLYLDRDGTEAQLQWAPVTNATGYDIVRGDLGPLLASDGDFEAATDICLANDTSATSFDDSDTPDPGEGFWYLVRPTTTRPGSYDSYEPSQVGSRDLEIDDATFGCR